MILDKFWQELYKSLIVYYNKGRNDSSNLASGPFTFNNEALKQEILANSSHLTKELQQGLATQVDSLLILAERDFTMEQTKEVKEELKQTLKLLKQEFLHFKLQELTQTIQQAENRGENTEKLLQEFNSLTEQLMFLS